MENVDDLETISPQSTKLKLNIKSTTRLSKRRKKKLASKIKKAKHSKTSADKVKSRAHYKKKKKLEMCNVPVQSLAADDAQMKVASFVPLLSDILQTFPLGVVTCCFCHLPANYLPGLGDLYGPYSPTFRDLTHYRELAQQNINVKTENPPDFISEITMDVDKKICFITTGTKSCTNKKKTVLSAGVPTAKEVEQSVSAMSPQLRIMHTLDYLLTDPKKTSRKHHNNERTGKFRIPGFSGNLNLKSSGSANSTENNTNLKKLMPGIETIVFIEPQDDTIPSKSPEKVSVTSPKRRKSAAAKLSDNITATHIFNTSDMWLHAPCAINAPGVCLIQGQLFGLHVTATAAQAVLCNYCGRPGATISHENLMFHYLCAIPKT